MISMTTSPSKRRSSMVFRIGSGQIDFRPILKTIEDLRFDGDVVIEIISENPLADAVASRTRLQTLL